MEGKRLSIFWLLVFTTGLSVSGLEKVIIVTPGFDHPLSQVARIILPEAYKTLGYDVEFKVVPPNRAYLELDEGTADGFVMADEGITREHPSAVIVPASFGTDDFYVFSKRNDLKIANWDSLKAYSVGYMSSMTPVEVHLKGVKSHPGQEISQVFAMLAAGRTDLVVMPKGVGMMMIKNMKLKDVHIIGPSLESVKIFHVVAGKRSDLAPKLAMEIIRLTKSGRLGEVTDQVFSEFQQ